MIRTNRGFFQGCESSMCPSHRIHVYIYLHLVDFYGFHVGIYICIYTSPMDPMGKESPCMCFGTLAFLGCDCNFCGVGLWLGTFRGLRARRLHRALATVMELQSSNGGLSFLVFFGIPGARCEKSTKIILVGI